MKKRILFIDHHAELGGGEIALLEIMKNLNRDRFSLLALLGNSGEFANQLTKAGVEVIVDKLPSYFRNLDRDPAKRNGLFLFMKSAFSLGSFIKKTKNAIIEKDIDIVYINSIKSSLYGVPAAKQTKRKIVWHLHDCLSREFYSPWVMPIIVRLSHAADRIICVSETVKEYFTAAGGRAEKVAVIYNGVDIEKFNPAISTEAVKREFNIADRKVVSVVGRLEPWKGQRVFIKAAKIICQKRDDVIFLIAGAPFFGFYDYEREIKDMVNQLGLKERVIFLGFRPDVEQIYVVSDIITHCSLRPEPFGRDIIEAFACAKAVISTNLGAPKEIISEKEGILIEPDNPEILAAGIMALLDDTRRLKQLGEGSRNKAKCLFNITEIAKHIERLL
ncbi:MAG: glycosyltransferase family 4 protein [Candidatus Omnitrophota bacterium]